MSEESKIVTRDSSSTGSVEVFSSSSAQFSALDLSSREPQLYDYLLILRKHQWLIPTFLSSSYLACVSTLDRVSVPYLAFANLMAIPTGPLPPNPADLLFSRRLAEAIAELRQKT